MLKYRIGDFCRQLLILQLLGTAVAVHADGLQDALQAALQNHPALAGQQARVDARRYAADGARSQRYPTLTALAQPYTNGGRAAVSGDELSQPALFRVRQPVWSFGRINSSIAVANAEVSTERADLLRVGRQLIEATAVAYAQVRGAREHIDITQQNVTEHIALLAQIQRRVEGQLASSADARLAATRLSQARAMLSRASSEWEIARVDLAGLTQLAFNADQPVPAAVLELNTPAELIETAMAESAEIRFREQQLGQADAEVDEARTSYMPTIYLQADKYFDQPGLTDDGQLSLVIEASLDGLGFAARGLTGEASASQMAATQELAAAKIELRRALESLQRDRELQGELIELQTQSVSDMESLLASYQRQYESGSKSWLDLMNIQRELFTQRSQLVQAHNDWVIYSLLLQARIGGLDSLAGLLEQKDG